MGTAIESHDATWARARARVRGRVRQLRVRARCMHMGVHAGGGARTYLDASDPRTRRFLRRRRGGRRIRCTRGRRLELELGSARVDSARRRALCSIVVSASSSSSSLPSPAPALALRAAAADAGRLGRRRGRCCRMRMCRCGGICSVRRRRRLQIAQRIRTQCREIDVVDGTAGRVIIARARGRRPRLRDDVQQCGLDLLQRAGDRRVGAERRLQR